MPWKVIKPGDVCVYAINVFVYNDMVSVIFVFFFYLFE